jgi:hypothetical protein
MSLNAKKIKTTSGGSGVTQKPLDAGAYPCRVVQVIDLGVQEQRPFQGKAKPPAHELMMGYEFSDEFCVDEKGAVQEDKPRWLSETFPLNSLKADKAKSTQRYYAIDPADTCDGDFTKLVAMPCLVNVTQRPHDGKVYNNIQSVSPMRAKDAEKLPALVNPPKVFLLDEPDMEIFLSLPEWLQDKIKKNLHFQGSTLQKLLGGSQGASKAQGSTDVAGTDDDAADDDPGANKDEW